MGDNISGIGVIVFTNDKYFVVKLKPDGGKTVSVCVPIEVVIPPRSVNKGDFVRVTAKRWTPGPEVTFNGITYKATSAKWHKKPLVVDCTGKIISIDAKGEFAYIESSECAGKKETIYATRVTFKPPSTNLNNELKNGSIVTVRAQEQPPNGNQSTVRFRTVVFTFSTNAIGDNDNEIYEKTAKRKVPGLNTATTSKPQPAVPPPPSTSSLVGSESFRGSQSNSGVNVQGAQKLANAGIVPSKYFFVPMNPLCTDEYEREAERIRQLCHALTANRCNFCLTRMF